MSVLEHRQVVISVPGHPVGANQVDSLHWAGRLVGMDGSRERKHAVRRDWQEAARLAWLEAGRPVFADGARVAVVAVFGAPARRDGANYAGSGSAKWIVDALTGCGMWPDDSDRWLSHDGGICTYERGQWRVEIHVTERRGTA